uniref:Uncharacterized protein n=1 Tax=Anopheles albimanus TaxID=7167 RepID=A0A182FF88_ANOAL
MKYDIAKKRKERQGKYRECIIKSPSEEQETARMGQWANPHEVCTCLQRRVGRGNGKMENE